MKKYGKYEKMPDGTRAKQPAVKSMLLQTYFTSLICLVLCVSMFFGTSYAWFTSEVNNTANEIYIGTLDVGLFKQNTSGQGTGLDDLSEEGNKLFDSNIRWEPGYTALETIQIVNEGDLAVKYVLSFTKGAAKDNEDKDVTLADVAKYFDVWVYDHRDNDNASPAPDSYAEITAKNSGWENAGSLDALLAGKTVLDGVMVTVRDSNSETSANEGTTDGVATEDTYTIALHMTEDADSAVMGQKISLNVKLVAYQMASEKDSFENKDYDSDVTAVSDARSLQSALSNGGNVQLITDVEIGDAEDRVVMTGGALYGNGKAIAYNGGRVNESSVGVVTTSGGIVKNLTIDGGEDGRALYITKLTSDLSVSDCIFSGAYAFNLNSADKTDYTLTFTNTIFKSWTSYANVVKCANFAHCIFEAVLKPYGDTTLTNCAFTTEGLDVSALENGKTITLINCTYNGVFVEKAVLTADGEGITITESDLIVVDGDKQVVLKTNG